MRDLYAEVTAQIVADLEKGVKPWTRPWKSTGHAVVTLPCNMATGRAYNGINTLVLWMTAIARGFPGHGWMTFKQALEYGGHVRKGEKGTPIIFVSFRDDEKDGKETRRPIVKWYSVFHAAQIEGLPAEALELLPPDVPEFRHMTRIADASGIPIHHGYDRACYIPSLDVIEMPAYGAFKTGHAYTRTLFHELAHGTGHYTRLNRELSGRFGSDVYAFEELIAELTSAFLCAKTGVNYDNENAEYIGAWVRRMKEDSRAIFTAASAAAKAADWLWEQ